MRTLSVAGQALIDRLFAGEQIPMVRLAFMDLEVPQYLTTAGIRLLWNSQTWSPVGGNVEAVDDDVGEFNGVVFTLPAVDEAQLALALVEDVEGVEAHVYDALVDPATGEVADAVLGWSGELQVPVITDGPVAEISVSGEHLGALAVRPKPTRYTNDEQQRLYPGDTSLDTDPATDAAPVSWPAASWFKK